MDFSTKVKSTTTTAAAEASGIEQSESTINHRSSSDIATESSSSPLTSDQQETGSFPCPACSRVLDTSRELTEHLRRHNSPRSTDCSGEEDYSCAVCHKVLSSASSLDRHVLVHSRERPFKCKYCDMAFTTRGNMKRHSKTAHASLPLESNGYTDSEGSCDSEKSVTRGSQHEMVEQEYNNNEIGKGVPPDLLNELVLPTTRNGAKRNVGEKRRAGEGGEGGGGGGGGAVIENSDVPSKKQKIMLNRSISGTQNGELKSDSGPMMMVRRCIKHMNHEKSSSSDKNSRNTEKCMEGFKDCCFVDFSIEKYPLIARAVCEAAIHLPIPGGFVVFQCYKCLRGFPCRSALDAHELDCGTTNKTQVVTPEPRASRREQFFSHLDLQNSAIMNEARGGLDLADINSILEITTNPMMEGISRSDASTPEHHQHQIKPNSSIAGSSGSSGTPSSSEGHHEEEAQDVFAAEFRRMKLKGEFPCRLCDAVFPNLRALKGHNRSHMGVGPGMPYPCNMCPYTSNDKGTLVRHLRSHNGDRPFECSLCNFAFTTKANCERHVRNRHGKTSREEIKSIIIYHPSEDSTNDSGSLEQSESRREDARKSLVYPPSASEVKDENLQRRKDFYFGLQASSNENNSLTSEHVNPISLVQFPHYENNDIFGRNRLFPQETSHRSVGGEVDEDQDDYDEYEYEETDNDYAAKSEHSARLGYNVNSRSSDDDGAVSLVSDTKITAMHQIEVQTSPINLKKSSARCVTALTTPRSLNGEQTGETSSAFATNEDAPLDLSMDALDLSKKTNGNQAPSPSSPVTSTMPNNEAGPSRSQKELFDAKQFFLTQALLKAGQSVNPNPALEALFANPHMMYPNFNPFPPAGLGLPYFLDPNLFGQDYAMKDRLHKEWVRGLQLTSGGNIVEPPTVNPPFPPAFPPAREIPPPRPELPNDFGRNVNNPRVSPQIVPRPSRRPSRSPKSQGKSSKSVKMVIKNGVLMPKQKQRRYRTERPFICAHCSAKFTLRSNMERHIKQQHPKYYRQRPRGGHSNRGRPPANPPNLFSGLKNYSPSLPANPAPQPAFNNLPSSSGSAGSSNNEKHAISNQVKYAILAQKLKGNKPEENDTEEELIIDESAHENREPVESQPQPQTTSLLRGKLEGTSDLYKKGKSRLQLQVNAAEVSKRNVTKSQENKRQEEHPVAESMESGVCHNVEIKIEPQDDEEKEMERQNVNGPSSQSESSELVAKVEQSTSRDCPTSERNEDLASVSELLDNASQQYQQFQPQYMSDEEGLVASTSDCNNSGSDEKSDCNNSANSNNSENSKCKKKKKKKMKKKSAYSMAPNRVICPYCGRPFPWTSSLRRHVLTHTGQKPFQCTYCTLLFTTKSNCDRHLLRKHKKIALKIRRMRKSASPKPLEQPSNNNTTNSNNNIIINTNTNNNNSASSAFAMRNVPERPYKCNLCPSSTFSTLGNLKKHKSSKHSGQTGAKSRAESPSTSEPRNSPIDTCNKQNDHSGYESQSSSNSENMDLIERMENLERFRASASTNQAEISVEPEVQQNQQQQRIVTIESQQIPNDNNLEIMECQDIAENSSMPSEQPQKNSENVSPASDIAKSRKSSPRSSPGPTDAPFKCHLCDSGFSERQDCLEHIRINHARSYEVLVAKGALDMDIETPEEQQQLPSQPNSSGQQHTSDGEEKRGRFPDYSNRKVVCAFCMRRFWSAEDLRRHMRTHTGERPFSCDICCRRFTLKHSMLRHRKKHESVDSMMYVGTSGDEEQPASSQPPTTTPRTQQQQQQQQQQSINMATVATGDAAPSGLMRFNPFGNLTTLTGQMANAQQPLNPSECPADTENDLISNLLGIRDKSIIDKVLQASPDDAAKLLGVNRHE